MNQTQIDVNDYCAVLYKKYLFHKSQGQDDMAQEVMDIINDLIKIVGWESMSLFQ